MPKKIDLNEIENEIKKMLDKYNKKENQGVKTNFGELIKISKTSQNLQNSKAIEEKPIKKKNNQLISTLFDEILNEFKTKKKIKLKELALKLRVSEQQLEEMATLLEKEGFLIVNYPPFGEITIEKKKQKEKEQ